MSITVYNISGSPMGWRVLLGLAFKGLDYDVVYLNGSENEHRLDAFLRINPHGKVPVLEHKGAHHRESLSILGWLDEQFPERPLFGKTTREIHAVWSSAARFSDYLLKSTNDVVFPVFGGADSSPKAAGEPTALDLAGRLLGTELAVLEHSLSNGPFLCGDTPTAADAVAFPEIGRIMRAVQTRSGSMSALGLGDFDRKFPRTALWRDRIAALPGHAKTVPPHWTTPTEKQEKS